MSYESLFDRVCAYARKHRLPWWSCDVAAQFVVFELPLGHTVPLELAYWKIDRTGRRLYKIDDQKRAGKFLHTGLFKDVVAPEGERRHLSRSNRGELV